MKRTNEKITDTIKSGKKPRRIRPRIIPLATVGLTEEERAAHDREWALRMGRARLDSLGYRTDDYGFLQGRDG